MPWQRDRGRHWAIVTGQQKPFPGEEWVLDAVHVLQRQKSDSISRSPVPWAKIPPVEACGRQASDGEAAAREAEACRRSRSP